MDFRAERLFLNKYRVKQLCVVGKAAESFWSLAFHKRRGMNSLVCSDVTTVELWGVVVGGRKKRHAVEVELTRADSELALRVAHAVVNLAEMHNFRVLDAVVGQKDANGAVVGEHDLLCERRCKLTGLSSFEVKLRQLQTRGLKAATVRRQVQTEAWRGKSGRFWPVAKDAGVHRKRDCAERVAVLLLWGPGDSNALGDWTDACAKALPATATANDAGDWAPVWGWKRPLLARVAPKLDATSVLRARARLRAAAKAKVTAEKVAARKRKQEFDAEYAKVRKKTVHRRELGSVSDLLTNVNTPACRRVRPTIGQKMLMWARKWGWPETDYGKHRAFAARGGGGEDGHGATKACLNDVYNVVKPAPPP